jgi:hypothetical protein
MDGLMQMVRPQDVFFWCNGASWDAQKVKRHLLKLEQEESGHHFRHKKKSGQSKETPANGVFTEGVSSDGLMLQSKMGFERFDLMSLRMVLSFLVRDFSIDLSRLTF